MTTWAPTNTPRVVLKYISATIPHSWTIRAARGTSPAAAVAAAVAQMNAFTTALAVWLPDDLAVTEGFFIPQDDTVAVPITPPPSVGGGDVPFGDYSTVDKATELRFAGKSNGGTVTHLSVFGIAINMDVNNDLPPTYGLIPGALSAQVSAAVAALNAGDTVAIDNFTISWYNRATVKVNDYWWRQARKTGGL